MHKLLLTALLSTVAIPALAADLPGKAPARPAAPVSSWTGFYLGIHGGYGWGRAGIDGVLSDDFVFLDDQSLTGFRMNEPKAKGWVFGGHAGYNVQLSPNWVGGFEIDYSAADIKDDQSHSVKFGIIDGEGGIIGTGTATRSLAAKIDALASARVRLGVLLSQDLLLYGTGGVAFARTKATGVDASVTTTPADFPALNFTDTIRSDTDHWGWAAGVGGEWRVFGAGSGWSLRAEYLHYDLGRSTHTFSGICTPECGKYTTSIDASLRVDVVRGGLSYKF
jgi:outer membrane immunogenic protein